MQTTIQTWLASPETNSKFSHLKMDGWWLEVLGRGLFSGAIAVSFRVSNLYIVHMTALPKVSNTLFRYLFLSVSLEKNPLQMNTYKKNRGRLFLQKFYNLK